MKKRFKPHDYQQEAINRIIDNKSVGLFLDMGLGKTAITLAVAKHLILEEFEIQCMLIIAPLQTALNTWTTEQEKWEEFKDLRISLILGSATERTKAIETSADIYVINRENVQWLCDYFDNRKLPWMFDMLVVDELSCFKNPSAKRFKAIKKKLPMFKKVVGLTGTPAPNGYMDLWSEVYLLDRGESLGKTIGYYRNMYFYPGWGSGHIVYKWNMKEGAKDAIDKKLSRLCVSMKAVDYLNMPDRIESEVYVEMSKSERKIYSQFVRDHVIPDQNVVGVTAATVQNKLLQMANGFAYTDDGGAIHLHDHKLEALSELIEAAQGQPVLVYYEFIEDKIRIMNEFPQAVELKGSDVVKAWNKGEIKLLLAHPASAGHGLNLQEGGNIIVWFGLPWSLELYQQANARLYRQGQEKPVYIYHLLTKDTHDVDVLSALQAKDQTQERLLKALKVRMEECI